MVNLNDSNANDDDDNDDDDDDDDYADDDDDTNGVTVGMNCSVSSSTGAATV